MREKFKLFALAPVAATLILFIFSLTIVPTVQPTVKNLPIAIINEDEGITLPDGSMQKGGEQVVQTILAMEASEETPKVKWTELSNTKEMNDAFIKKQYYAALYIPRDFSANRASLLSPSPVSVNLELYINQGLNATAATVTTQILNSIVTQLNQTTQSTIYAQLDHQGLKLSAKQAQVIANAVQAKTTIVHPVGENSANGNSPVSLFQPTWIASMITAILLFLALNELKGQNVKLNLRYQTIALSVAILCSIIIGFVLTSFAKYMVGMTITSFTATALLISLASLAFMLLLLALLSFIGFAAMPLFILLLFFGAPLLAVPTEMMSEFYSNWIYPWLPMRFLVEGLREVFFFNTGFKWSTATASLTYIVIGSLVVVLLAAFKTVKRHHIDERL